MLNSNPAEQLLSKGSLGNGWQVAAKVPKANTSTGANFSVGYVVKDDSGKQAFLKALDFSEALRRPNPTVVLQGLTTAFNYERMLLSECRSRKLDRVAVSIDDGEIPVGDLHPVLPVPYLIFDLADGDVRRKLDLARQFELAFSLRALHHCSTGIQQLHNLNIAHQDLKPSNVLVFDSSSCRVADLGRSALQGSTSPTDGASVPGDQTYAPPELLYGEVSPDWRTRHLACDLYHVGSLAVFFFTKVGITALWHYYLDRPFWHDTWGQSYRDVLPYVRNAHDFALSDFEVQLPANIKDRLGVAIRQLCDPDPLLRGHPINRSSKGNPYALERYVACFDYLASVAEWQMKRTNI